MYAGGAAASSPEEVVEETKGRSRSSSSVGSELVLDEPFPREDVSTPLPIQTLQTPTSERSRSPLLTGRSWSDAITDRMPGMNWFQSTDGAGPAVDTGEGGRSSNKNGGAADGRAGSNTCVTGNLRADEADGGGGAEDEAAGMSPLPDSIAALKEIFDCETIEIDAGAFNGVVFSTWDNILGNTRQHLHVNLICTFCPRERNSKKQTLHARFHLTFNHSGDLNLFSSQPALLCRVVRVQSLSYHPPTFLTKNTVLLPGNLQLSSPLMF